MNVLWISNILFPAPCKALGLPTPVLGGWMYASAKALTGSSSDVKLAVAAVYKTGENIQKMEIDGIIYYLLPLKGNNTKYDKSLEPLWRQVTDEFHPDLVHLHGTEFAHGLAYLKACPDIKSVVSIQGLISVCARYYYGGISPWTIFRNISIRDIIKRDTLFQQKRKFQKRGQIECEILKRTRHIIGRTSWDKAHAWAINPDAVYHLCNEILRPSFYEGEWEYEKCEKYSIFLSQSGYPIKGLHQVIKALPFVLKAYPDARVYVAGSNIISSVSWWEQLKITGYGRYIRSLIRKYDLSDKVEFVGIQNEMEIKNRYLSANVFLCPSVIENSPNSLGEAQLLGVPHIASYVGGSPDMMIGNEACLYRFEEVEMLAEKICRVFEKKEHAMKS